MDDVVALRAGDAAATIALTGAEPLSWRIGERELLWGGDDAHWGFRAPILFPVVGASRGGAVTVDGASYPVPQHGFARTARFAVVEALEGAATLRLVDDEATRAAYPFRFSLQVAYELRPDRLNASLTVANRGDRPMPYAIGVHPAFPSPPGGEGARVVFDEPEAADVPEVAPGGLLARSTRPVPMDGRTLPLSPELFTEALVFLRARSRGLALHGPDGSGVRLEVDRLPHLAVWTKPSAPFVSLEAWSGHADWADARGELSERASTITLPPGTEGRHDVSLVRFGA